MRGAGRAGASGRDDAIAGVADASAADATSASGTSATLEPAAIRALGATDGAIMRTFMTEGVIIGGIGTVLGVSTGLALCAGLSWFGLRLDPDVYYIDRLPINVSGLDYGIVTLAALTICTVATIFPAKQASRIRPVDGLRYE